MSKSTGPRTPRGKLRSSQNAAKHFILSKRILPEERQEAAILRSGLEKDFEPQSLIEREMIDDLTLNRLLKRRIDMAFVGELNIAIDEKAIELRENRDRSIARYYHRLANGLDKGSVESAELAERLRPEYCIRALQGLVARISDRGLLPEDLNALQGIFGDQPTEFGAAAMRLLAEAAPAQAATDEADTSTGKHEDATATDQKELQKKKILDVLQAEIRRQENRHAVEMYQVSTKFVLDLQEPFHHALERRIRYSSANAREFNGILDNFERIRRLQRSATPTRADNSP